MRSSTFIVGVLMIASLAMPAIGTAQTASSTESVVEASTTAAVLINSSSMPIVQDAADTQETLPGDILISTVDPTSGMATSSAPFDESATSTGPTGEATSTPASVATSTDSETETATSTEPVPDPTPESVPGTNTIDAPDAADAVVIVTPTELAPSPKYTFHIGARRIAAKKATQSDPNNKEKQTTVSTDANIAVDTSKGELTVSGACTAEYYVVLLYKNADDYNLKPRSYVINKAYPCQNGAYAYSISDLPESVGNGTYYLLIAEEADDSSWTPISSVTPIDINRN